MAITSSMAAASFTSRNTIIPAIVLVFLIFAAAEVAGEPPSVVPPACEDAYAVSNNSFTVDFCLSTLTGHSAGATDYADLVPITVDLTTANATSTKAKLDDLVAGAFGRGPLFFGLRSCQDLYDAVVRVYLPICHAAASDRRFADVKSCLGRTLEAAETCDLWFRQRKLTSPIAKENDDLAKLANLGIAITKLRL